MKQATSLDRSTALMQLMLDSSLASRAFTGAVKEINTNPDVVQLAGRRVLVLGEPGPLIEHDIVPGYGQRVVVYHNGAEEMAGKLISRFFAYYGKMPTWERDN